MKSTLGDERESFSFPLSDSFQRTIYRDLFLEKSNYFSKTF
jgi:hypothetical protein